MLWCEIPTIQKKVNISQVLKRVFDVLVALVYDHDFEVYWTWGSFFCQRLEMHTGMPSTFNNAGQFPKVNYKDASQKRQNLTMNLDEHQIYLT